jgi:hypothetical protein
MISALAELLTVIGRVRRAMPLNRDVMLICDALERNVTQQPQLAHNVTQPPSPPEHNVTTAPPALCAECAVRRDANARRQARFRAKLKSLEGVAA